jgi:transcriptional regulator
MYQPPHHREARLTVMHRLIERFPLGLLISHGPDGLVANAIPFTLEPHRGQFGTLKAHLARANPQWKQLDQQGILVVFQGATGYISPSHYATKQDTGKVVPTYNYEQVQARGIAQVHQSKQWLDDQINALTDRHEIPRHHPWAVSDAPEDYINSQLRGIVGIEIEIQSLDGKWKVSQNRDEADRVGVARGLASENPAMAEVVQKYSDER